MKIKDPNPEVVELLTNDENQVLRFSQFEVFGGGSFRCNVFLKSRGFAFDKKVTFDNSSLFIDSLEKMATILNGEAELKEEYHDHVIKFSLVGLGHLIVSGSFVEYSEHTQNLTFEFKTDQTCLQPFAKGLKAALCR